MKAHFETCTTNSSEISEEKITKILDSSNSLSKLYALEALYISEIKSIIKGNIKVVINQLKTMMLDFAEDLKFEEAETVKQKIQILSH